MDSEELKSSKDCKEIDKLIALRVLLYQIRCLINCPEAGEEMYNDMTDLIAFIEKKVEPLLYCFTSNYLENAKRWLYIMLKYACEDFVTTVNARRQNIQPPVVKENLVFALQSLHEKYFDLVFDPTFKLWTNKETIININKNYCKIMSHLFYNSNRDIESINDMNKMFDKYYVISL